ncbi:MAG: excinuclease ABC subunit UvrC [Dehalococcoidia bacterium]|nr:MAG: excinuclease ABC subunit UvrC [Dehalococcoidia bacterium]
MNKIKTNPVVEIAKQLPAKPGVYLMKDAKGSILYIGKAASLLHRVRSYFNRTGNLPNKTRRMIARLADIDFFITSSEEEALILELNLIKRYSPYYNVRLKDDKTFPYLKIDVGEDWPRVQITRHLEGNGSRYFGPFASTKSIRRALKVVKDIFPFRPCSKNLNRPLSRPCLEYDLLNCSAPCIGLVNREEYVEIIKQLILFLEGRQETIIKRLEVEMKEASKKLDYEKAAILRDRIQAVKEVIKWQKMASVVRGDQDAIAFARDRDQAYAQVFFTRGGKLVGREGFTLQGAHSVGDGLIMSNFVKQFYNSASYIPPLILLQHPVEDKKVIESWLMGRRGSRVRIQVPNRGARKKLIDMVAENASRSLKQIKIKQITSPAGIDAALEEIKNKLGLSSSPSRIEGYDISNIQGRSAVGSMVVFDKGKPKKASYRRFKIKTVPTADDYAMLREVIYRRFGRFKNNTPPGANSWAVMPDLVLIDGGRGQLNSVIGVMDELGIKSVPVASIAKENEQIFTPDKIKPVMLSTASLGLQLLQCVRDEAHRFALSYHHHIHQKGSFTSTLDVIPGIGPRRRRILLRQFGSISAIKEATLEELAAVDGFNLNIARRIKEYL